jgi:hypothetical protein
VVGSALYEHDGDLGPAVAALREAAAAPVPGATG